MATGKKEKDTRNVLRDVLQKGKKSWNSTICYSSKLELFELEHWKSSTPENQIGSFYSRAIHRPLGKWWSTHFPEKKLLREVNYNSIFAVSKTQLLSISFKKYFLLTEELSRSPLQEEAHYLERVVPSLWFQEEIIQRKKRSFSLVLLLFLFLIIFLFAAF
jgi:hypothetical protein